MSLKKELKLQEVKNKLENWKEIIIPLYKILIWEKQWHPFAIAGVTTSIFLFIWLSDMSVLTIFSLLGLIITVSDYLVPIIVSSLMKPDSWTPQKEALLDTLCGEILIIKMKIELDCSTYCKLRESHPKMYVTLTAFALGMLAWFGNIFNNLLIAYLLVTSILLLPGAERTKVYSHIHEIQNRIFKEYVNPRFQATKKEE
ncbi:ADP-ribosylation factor-like protein 6-interacting protein 1 isoform X2 [Coccinella septempunctata]|uniref:ADP-ribosylation factor-like protein 6-interacting protein 1 isoform X2 n=1 Tax=Coccinella septempunctata TaxID=41139 RepID=UPI001D074611|nr:ADP-ribosylation factor-like protein 6-interacting protein 1 isoform X2 [Coccinella septempunctata]